MDKEKKEGTEEVKEEFGSLDDAYQPTPEEEQAEKEIKAPETDTTETEEVKTDEAKGSEETEEGVKTETEDAWRKHGIARFDGMSRKAIAAEFNWRNRQAGEQAREVGELRKRVAELDKGTKAEPEKPKGIDLIPDMTPGQVEDYNRLYEINPVKAIFKYGGDKYIKAIVGNQDKGDISEEIKATLEEQKEGIAYTNFCANNDDWQELDPLMKQLDQEQHLGNQRRSYGELAKLARLGRDGDKLYNSVYVLMSKHPTMSFADAKRFVSPQATSTSTDDVRKTVKKIDAANLATKKSTTTNNKDYESIDDAFDSVVDED